MTSFIANNIIFKLNKNDWLMMTKLEKKKLLLTVIFGPLGLFSISGTGGVILTLLAIIMANSFYSEIGYIPFIWYVLFIVLSLVWALSALKNKEKSNYFPYAIQIYKKEDKDYKYFINILAGMFQFALVLFVVAMCYKITIN